MESRTDDASHRLRPVDEDPDADGRRREGLVGDPLVERRLGGTAVQQEEVTFAPLVGVGDERRVVVQLVEHLPDEVLAGLIDGVRHVDHQLVGHDVCGGWWWWW